MDILTPPHLYIYGHTLLQPLSGPSFPSQTTTSPSQNIDTDLLLCTRREEEKP
jgi:hypothetical protein